MERLFNRQRGAKNDGAEMQLLALLEEGPFHGYEITKLIHLVGQLSDAAVEFQAASLYPMLYRLQKRGWIEGRWVELPGKQRRRYYRLTAAGRKVLGGQRQPWRALFCAVERAAQVGHA